jgi:hypothetical protein
MDIKKLIQKKIDLYNEKLVIITETVDSEMAKEIYKRNNCLLDFLHKEKAVYKFSLAELMDVLNYLLKNEK